MFNVTEIITATKAKLVKGPLTLRLKGVCTDSRKIAAGELFIPLAGNSFNGNDFILAAAKAGANAVILEEKHFKKNKQILQRLPFNVAAIVVKNTLSALGNLAAYRANKFSLPTIALTGSSGKTTTKEMIAAILACRYKVLKTKGTENNLVGVPLNLLRLDSSYEIACLEFGTSSFGEIAKLSKLARPSLGVITNIADAHLEKLGNREGVFREKSTLLDCLRSPAVCLVNYDDAYLRRLATKRKHIFGFGKERVSDFFAKDIAFKNNKLTFRLKGSKQLFAMKTFGMHNIHNALCAIGVGLIFGISLRDISAKLASLKFYPARFNLFKIRGLTIIDDTYNSNPLSFESALHSLGQVNSKKRKILVVADMLELGEKSVYLHRQMGKLFKRGDVDFILSLGDLAAVSLKSAINGGFNKKRAYAAATISELKERLRALLKKGDVVLVKGSRAMRMERIVNFLRNMI